MTEIGKIVTRGNHVVEWTIEDFFSYTEEGEWYSSRKFSISGHDWQLNICPNGDNSEDSGWISLYLYFIDTAPACACFSFGVKKVDGTIEQFRDEITWEFDDKYFHGFPDRIEKSKLLLRKSELAPSEVLTLTCTLRTKEDFLFSSGLDTLSRNLVDLFTSKKGSDVTLKVKGKEFAVHRLILSARSPVLASMFEVDMKEKRTGIVEISDCDPDAFREFLTYLYSSKLEDDCRNPIELYKIADKYDVQDLKLYCCMCIMGDLSVENVLDAAVFAHQFDQKQIETKTQKFFNENFMHVMLTTEWDEFLREKLTLAIHLMKGMAKAKVAEINTK